MFLRYFYTLKHLKMSQTFGRIFFNLSGNFIRNSKIIAFETRNIKAGIYFHPKKICYLGQNNFVFLNKQKKLLNFEESYASDEEILWKYNLHYFDFLNQLGANEKDNKRLVLNWIETNKFKSNVSWDPFPTSLRVVNWIKWIINNQIKNKHIDENLLQQGIYLSKRIENHITGNHLISNAKALIFLGFYFSSVIGNEILKKGKELLIKELKKQILNDGSHFERSSMYQALIIEDLLDIYSLSQRVPHLIDRETIKKYIKKMSQFQLNMTHSSGEKSYFNDCSEESSLSYKEISSYAKKLGIELERITEGIIFHKNSGFVSCKDSSSNFIVNYGSIAPDELMAHANANSLSFEFSLDNQKVFVNSGCSSYQNLVRRNIERATSAHNTLEIDGKNSSDIWASFRCGKRAKTHIIEDLSSSNCLDFKVFHDGYSSLVSNRFHFRKFFYDFSSMKIEDYIQGKFKYAVSRIHLHPDVVFKDKSIYLKSGKKIMFVYENCELKVINSFWTKGFGQIEKNKTLEFMLTSRSSQIKFTW